MAETNEMQALAEELKPQLLAIRDRFDAAETEDEEQAIAKEGVELMARALIRQMLAKFITPEAIANFVAAHHSGGCISQQALENLRNYKGDWRGEFVEPKP
jgi:tRNA(Ile)-lysidine synthase TilS/MesJ